MSNDKKRVEANLEEKDARTLEPLEHVEMEKELETLGDGKEANVLTRKTTTISTAESSDDGMGKAAGEATKPPRKTWSEKLNPLKYRKIPPVPKERIVSREHGASLWSKLTFQWITPIMTVCNFLPEA